MDDVKCLFHKDMRSQWLLGSLFDVWPETGSVDTKQLSKRSSRLPITCVKAREGNAVVAGLAEKMVVVGNCSQGKVRAWGIEPQTYGLKVRCSTS